MELATGYLVTMQNTSLGKCNIFNKWCIENWIATCKRKKLNPYIIAVTKINLNRIKGLNMKPETIKLLGEKGEKSSLTCLGNDFLNMTLKA